MSDAAPMPKPSRRSLVLAVLLTAAVAAPLGGVAAHHLAAPGGPAAPAEQYVCPMHPSVVMDHEGTCPICGMKLVKAGASRKAERTPRFYRNPMDPRQTSPVPMKDSMGMDYLPVYEDAAPVSEAEGLAVIDIDPAQQQLIGLRTARVDRGVVGGAIRTVGRVAQDETRVRHIAVRVPGYVERVFVDFVGKAVKRGQPLFSLYSPDVLAAENELLVALASGGPDGRLVAAARRKLELWSVPAAELQRLERQKTPSDVVTFVSPVDGVVTKKDVVEGFRLEAGAMPYEVVDLSAVWVLAEVYESELRWVTPGVPATLRVSAYPEQTWSGKVLFVDPVLDPRSRTARARLAFANPSGELKPELFGEVTLQREPREVLRVPVDAVVRTGTESVVFVSRGEGRFEPHLIRTGEVGREYAEVLEGLEEGEPVVTRANFLVDSESRLQASLARMSTPPGGAADAGTGSAR